MTGKPAAEKAAALPSRFKFTKPDLDLLLKSRPADGRIQRSYSDTKSRGLTILVSMPQKADRDATITFRATYYSPSRPGVPRYKKIGCYPHEIDNIERARDIAAKIRADAKGAPDKAAIDPKRAPLPTEFAKLVPLFIESKKENKHWRETERLLNRYVLPEWRDMRITNIDRPDVTALIDKIAAKKIRKPGSGTMGGMTTADRCLAALSSMMNWYLLKSKDSEFRNPVAKGMRKTSPKERRRTRKLNSFEIRALWRATADIPVYGDAVRILLLTGQRLRKVTMMRRSEIKERMLIEARERDGRWEGEFWIENVWDPIKDDDGENKRASLVPLSPLALEIINNVPIIAADDGDNFVFSLNGHSPINGMSKFKERLDDKMRNELAAMRALPENAGADLDLFALKPWVIHDLRRTARTLMARTGINSDICERCLGHAIGGIRAAYDRHDYILEKRDAFNRLSNHIKNIISPHARENIVPLIAKHR